VIDRIAGLAMVSKPTVEFTGYWQRHIRKSRHARRSSEPSDIGRNPVSSDFLLSDGQVSDAGAHFGAQPDFKLILGF
jgi:hypothetical protein